MSYYKKFQVYTLDDSDLVSAVESSQAANRPGKFESNPEYTAYCWDRTMGELPDDSATTELWESWGFDSDSVWVDDLPEVYCFTVTMLDALRFPQLTNVSAIYLYEDDQGFVNLYDVKTSDSDKLEFWGL